MELPGNKFVEKTVECFGYAIPYAEAGKGDTIVSFPGSAGLEMSTAKDLLARDYRVIEIDPPGWGKQPQTTGKMRMRDLGTILAGVLKELDIGEFHLIGTSMGGTNAFWMASQYPNGVKSITLEAPMLFPKDEDMVHPEGKKMIEALQNGAPAPDFSAYPAPPAHPRKPWSDADFFRQQMRNRFKMMAKVDHAYDAPELRAFASNSTIPTQMLLGTQDEVYNQSYAETFKSAAPKAYVKSIENGTHDLQNSTPEAFVGAFKEISDLA